MEGSQIASSSWGKNSRQNFALHHTSETGANMYIWIRSNFSIKKHPFSVTRFLPSRKLQLWLQAAAVEYCNSSRLHFHLGITSDANWKTRSDNMIHDEMQRKKAQEVLFEVHDIASISDGRNVHSKRVVSMCRRAPKPNSHPRPHYLMSATIRRRKESKQRISWQCL